MNKLITTMLTLTFVTGTVAFADEPVAPAAPGEVHKTQKGKTKDSKTNDSKTKDSKRQESERKTR